jgi:dolichol-phosphate mannosyltransferase
MDNAELGVVIPSYLEGANITKLITAVGQFCPGAKIVVVDDSPNTETVDAVKAMKLSHVHTIHRKEKGGRGSAVIEGIQWVLNQGCSWVIEMDADFSHPPSQLPELLAEAKSKRLDLLIGSRYLPTSKIDNWPISRRIFSKCANTLSRVLLQVPIHDYTNGYRVYSKAAAQLVLATCGKLGKGFIALSEILVNVYYRGYAVGEVPTNFTNRIRGQSSLNSSEITNAFLGLFKILKLKLELVSSEKKKCQTGNH